MEEERKVNKKGMFLLIVLCGFAFFVVKTTKVNDINIVKASSESTVCANNIVDQGYDNTPVFLNISENGEITNVTPKTKNTGSVLGSSCGNAINKYTGTSACTIKGTKGTVSITGWVSSDAPIKIVSITSPIKLLSGIFSIENSNRKITIENPVYKPAGEQFDNKQILVNSTPGEGNAEIKKKIIDDSVKQKAYSTKYSVSTEGEEGNEDLEISQYAENDCGAKCNNVANSNPDKSNKAAKFFKNTQYRYAGQKDNVEKVEMKVEGECENINPVEMGGQIPVCFNPVQVLYGIFGTLFPSSDWTNCGENEEGCINSEEIVLKISPMFADTNAYMNTRNKTAMYPEASASYKSVYVLTDCLVNVANKPVSVKCAWDMSYLFDERKAAEFDDVGGSDTPTEDQYIKILKKESTGRTDPLYQM